MRCRPGSRWHSWTARKTWRRPSATAEFEVAQAQQALDDLQTEAETARVQAMQDIVTYERAVRDAQYALDNFTVPAEPGRTGYRRGAQPDEAAPGTRPAQAFEPYKYRPSGDATRQDRKEAISTSPGRLQRRRAAPAIRVRR